MVFAFIGSLDLRPVVSPASGRGLASYSMRELALQSPQTNKRCNMASYNTDW